MKLFLITLVLILNGCAHVSSPNMVVHCDETYITGSRIPVHHCRKSDVDRAAYSNVKVISSEDFKQEILRPRASAPSGRVR